MRYAASPLELCYLNIFDNEGLNEGISLLRDPIDARRESFAKLIKVQEARGNTVSKEEKADILIKDEEYLSYIQMDTGNTNV